MEKRVLLAIFLSFLVLYVFQALFVKPVPKPGAPGSAKTTQTPAATTPVPGAPASAPTPEAPPAPSIPSAPAAATLVGDAAERDVPVETPFVTAVFTNRGARLKSWRLKRFLDADRQPLELVTHEFGDAQPMPFSLGVSDPAITKRMNDALFTVTGAPAGNAPVTSPTQITFEFRDDDGLRVVKQFRIDPTTYVVEFGATVTHGDRSLTPSILWGPGLGDVEVAAGRSAVKTHGLFAVNNQVKRVDASAVAKQPTYQGDFQYAGIGDHYFMSTALHPGPSTIALQPLTIPPPAGSKDPPREFMAYSLEPGRRDSPLIFYIGPKDFDVLAAVDRDFVRAIDFGMFAVIVVPLLRTLNWIHGYVGNYGWSIVILTLIINLLMFPLRHKQVVSMRKMQSIQPEVKAIQERYAKFKASDPQKQNMNKELMQLYKDRGVNPAAGCLPMLLPLPVFFAFYALLYTAIELRGAPFVGWIHDLSRPDPLYVTPVVMGLTQFWQQWLMPAAGVDPAQQKMMMVMPLVFTFIFLTLPSGVVLYWVVNNFWAIGQQYLTNRIIGPQAVRNVRPAAERRVKRVGAGKTDAAKDQKDK
jgi:YidC/Oxa1 family membrane protein insertase